LIWIKVIEHIYCLFVDPPVLAGVAAES
jgi:hypothetical protein